MPPSCGQLGPAPLARPTSADAVAAARRPGIGSINLDLLYDVPGQTLATWTDASKRALALAPDHLSLYALTLDDPDAEGLTGPGGDHLPTTAGARRWRERARPNQDDDRAAAMYHLASHRLAEAGFRGYEMSNWARPGHESRHNLAYWERRPVEAVGPGAHAFDGVDRRWNAARLDGYVAALRPADPASRRACRRAAWRPASTPPPRRPRRSSWACRLDAGVPLLARPRAAVRRAPSPGRTPPACSSGPADGRVRLRPSGRLLSNELFARLI